ncbi:unnamed protein product [Mytilus edulis]|uniref:G-protein coupled receptors family 1 profile domain-containing protein n=1 Tax=Mytilus edulis TaxID=6550 RepID=A0A8S3V228_MYTED|nr:unnamed protein product [Mytilus edulis]
MSIDRLYVIVRPLSAASKGQKYRFGLASVAWITGAVLAVQYAVHIISWKTVCVHIIPYMEAMIYIDATIIIIIPVIIIVICYTGIIITIRRREKRGFIPANRSDTVATDEIIPKDRVISNAKIKTIKLLLVVVCDVSIKKEKDGFSFNSHEHSENVIKFKTSSLTLNTVNTSLHQNVIFSMEYSENFIKFKTSSLTWMPVIPSLGSKRHIQRGVH